jgi:putative PIN family toxin of toxin-antitoxin system
MSTHRVFVDTNVIISGILYDGGNEAGLLNGALLGRIRLVLAQVVIDETRRVLKSKFPQEEYEFEDFLSTVDCDLIDYPDKTAIEQASEMIRDPNDAPILASILLAKPDHAITGDKDLLTDEVKAVAPVCRCAEYLELIDVDRQPTTED